MNVSIFFLCFYMHQLCNNKYLIETCKIVKRLKRELFLDLFCLAKYLHNIILCICTIIIWSLSIFTLEYCNNLVPQQRFQFTFCHIDFFKSCKRCFMIKISKHEIKSLQFVFYKIIARLRYGVLKKVFKFLFRF